MNFTSTGTVEVSSWVGEGGMGGRWVTSWVEEDLCEMSPALALLKLVAFV